MPEPRLPETVALGLLQGPAELLPISSSAHVELLPWLLGWEVASLDGARRKEVGVALHARHRAGAAAGAPAADARRRMVPAAAAGYLLEDFVEQRLGKPRSMAAGLVAGSVALVASDRAPQRRGASGATLRDALWIGLAQATALVPGVSRSGATRSAARALGFTREAAAELSTEVALPILVGATVLKGVRLAQRRPPAQALVALGAGTAAAWASTTVALRLRRREPPPAVFAAYRIALAAVVIATDRRVRHNRSR